MEKKYPEESFVLFVQLTEHEPCIYEVNVTPVVLGDVTLT
jgi:hypothetical protein